MKKKQLQIGGFIPFSALDYPDHLSAVVFCQGCTWRCGYCHNHSLQPFSKEPKEIHWERVLSFLQNRKGLLESVVFSGGEPTLQLALPEALSQVKNLGYKVGLHTAGTCPSRLKRILPFIDWIGMDCKAPSYKYDAITRIPGSYKSARQSAQIVIESGIDYEFRTTVHHSLLSEEDLQNMANELSLMGAKHLVLQKFQPNGCNETHLLTEARCQHIPHKIEEKISPLFESFSIRG